MEGDILKNLQLQLRPSKGRPLMTEFLRNHEFITSQSPLIDSELLKLKMKAKSPKTKEPDPENTSRLMDNKSSLSSTLKNLDTSTQVGIENFSPSSLLKLSPATKRVHPEDHQSSQIMSPEIGQIETEIINEVGLSFSKKTKFTFSPIRIRSANKQRHVSHSEERASATAKKHSVDIETKNSNISLTETLGLNLSNHATVSGNQTMLRQSSKKLPGSRTHRQETEKRVFNDSLSNSVELQTSTNFKTKRASYIWNKFFPEEDPKTTKQILSDEIHRSPKVSPEGLVYKYGVSKICPLPKNKIKRFHSLCDYVEQWNYAEKLNQELLVEE